MQKTIETVLVGLAAFAVTFLTASPVLGYNDWKSNSRWFGNGVYTCVFNISKIGNGPNGGGAAQGITYSEAVYYSGYPCPTYAHLNSVPAGWIAVDLVAWKQNLFGGWDKCLDTGYKYNTSTSNVGTVTLTQNQWNPPCGAGTYQVVNNGYVWSGSAWVGGGVNSPNMYLPCATASCSTGKVSGQEREHFGRPAPEAPAPVIPPL